MFRTRTQLLNTLPLAAGDTPGYPANTRFPDNGEPAEVEVINRGMAALAENTDDINTRITRDIAVPVVGAFAFGAPDDEIVIDMTGGAAGDINYTNAGSLFMGSAGWPDNKVNRDNLFQFLDDEYNEVLVGGEEVYCGGTIDNGVGAAIGDGFHTAPAVTIELRTASQNPVTVPAGNYRLGYFEGSDIGSIDEATFTSVSVRGLQESPAESNRKAVYVIAIDQTRGAADYVGATAIQEAIADLGSGVTLFVRHGSYTLGDVTIPANPLNVAAAGIRIIGETKDGEMTGVILNLQAGHDLTVSGDGIELDGVRVNAPGAGQKTTWTGDRGKLTNFHLDDVELVVKGGGGAVPIKRFQCESGMLGGSGKALTVGDAADGYAEFCTFKRVEYEFGSDAQGSPMIDIVGAMHSTFESLKPELIAPTAAFQDVLRIGSACANIVFKASRFEAYDGRALVASGNALSSFESCHFESRQKIVSALTLFDWSMIGCHFVNSSGNGNYVDDAVVLEHNLVTAPGTSSRYGFMANCYFYIRNNGDGVGAGAVVDDHIKLSGWHGENVKVVFDGTTVTYDSTFPAIRLLHCDINRLDIDFGDTQVTATGVSLGAVRIGSASAPSTVKDLVLRGMEGTWDASLVVVIGSEDEGRSILDGATVFPGIDWNMVSSIVFHLSDYSTLRRLHWHRPTIHATFTFWGIIGNNGDALGTGDDLAEDGDHIRIEDCWVDVNDKADQYRAIIRLASPASSIAYFEILNNQIKATDGSGVSCLQGVITVADAGWGKIRGNWIYTGFIDGAGEVTLRTAIYMPHTSAQDYMIITDNHILAMLIGGDNARKKIIYVCDSSAFSSIIHQNILQDVSLGITPTIGNNVTSGDAAHLNVVANNVYKP